MGGNDGALPPLHAATRSHTAWRNRTNLLFRPEDTRSAQVAAQLVPQWHWHAACVLEHVDPERFAPPPGVHGNTLRPLRALCGRCEVRLTCLIAGRGEAGLWGGLTEDERRPRPTMSWTVCNFDPCLNLLAPAPHAGGRRHYCCRLHRDRAARQALRPRAADGTPLEAPIPTYLGVPARGRAISKRTRREGAPPT